METTASTSLRLPIDLVTTIKTMAEEDHSSVSNFLRKLIAYKEASVPDVETWNAIRKAEEEYEQGKTVKMLKGESLSDFIARTANV